jgi:glucokinase
MSSTPLFVGVDVGGQTIKGGVVDDTGRSLSAVSVPTEAARGQEHGLNQMCLTVRKAAEAAGVTLGDVAAIGIATPGTMDIPAGIILDPPNLRPWQNVPVRHHLEVTFGKPTAFQNDANAAAFGEYWVGSGQGTRSLVLFTLGTGIGCGIVIDGQILEGRHSHGAEVGHIIVAAENGRLCGCGQPGHLEAYASALAVVKRTEEALAADEDRSLLHALRRDQGGLTARDVFQTAAAGDELAGRIVRDTARYLAVGAVNMMHTIDPDMVVFAGGMTAAGEPFLGAIRGYVRQWAFPVLAEKIQVRFATLGSDAGYIGAAACGRQLYHGR